MVITDLNNYCVPLIRYRVGDVAEAFDNSNPCACGRGLPRIGNIEGRTQSIIKGTNGSYLPGTFFSHVFKDYDYLLKQYKVIQEKEGEITLQIVKALRFDKEKFNEVITILRRYLGSKMIIKVEFKEEIKMINGKHQVSISKLDLDMQKNNMSQLITKKE